MPDFELTRKKIIELKETTGRNMVLSPSHEVLTEHELLISNSRHWYGLKSKDFGCPCLDKTKDITEKQKIIQKLIKLKFANDVICKSCNKSDAYPQKDCRYKKQFEKIKEFPFVLAPMGYAPTKYIDTYDPQEIVVDNCLLGTKPLPPKGLLELQLRYLHELSQPYHNFQSTLTLEELNDRKDYNYFLNVTLREQYDKKIINKFVEQIKKEDWKESTSDYHEWFLVQPNDIDIYCKLAGVYGYHEQFGRPYIFYLFDYLDEKREKESKEVKLTIIDVPERINFLKTKKLVERYRIEKGVIINFVDERFETENVDHGSEVIEATVRVSKCSKKVLGNRSTRMNIKEMIEWFLVNRHNNDTNLKIGLIVSKPKGWRKMWKATYNKKLMERRAFYIPERFKDVKVETHYGNRGKNSLADRDVLFIVGTPNINKYNIEQEFIFLNGYAPQSVEPLPKELHTGFYHYPDPELEEYRRLREEDESCYEIHMAHPLNSKKIIYVFGEVPKYIEEEGIRVKKIVKKDIINFERKKWLEEFVKQKGSVVAVVAEEAMVKQFKEIKSLDWAYRIVRKIVAESEHLTLKRGGIFYE